MIDTLLALGPSVLITTWLGSTRRADRVRFAAALAAGMLAGVVVLELLPLILPRASIDPTPGWPNALLGAWALAALPEESAKFFALLAVAWPGRASPGTWLRCGAVVGLGYAAFESLLHLVFRPGDFDVVLLRSVTSLPAHALFGVYAGALLGGLGRLRGPLAALAAWLAATALHVGYDAPIVYIARRTEHEQGSWIAVTLFAVTLGGGWLGAQQLARHAARLEESVTR